MRERIVRTALLTGLVAAGLGSAAGCSDKLETGWEPRRLEATPAERRAYYASPFTPEAAAAQQAQQGRTSAADSTDDVRDSHRAAGPYR
jgi:hypothetical protein